MVPAGNEQVGGRMTTASEVDTGTLAQVGAPPDHRGSPVPTFPMIASKFNELRKRRGLMVALILVTIGIPTVYLVIRLLLHAFAPKTYGPAGGADTYTARRARAPFLR